MAVEFLKSRGVKILERNYQNRFGEIDIIAFFLNENHYFNMNIRFDCIGIMGSNIDWVKGAFY